MMTTSLQSTRNLFLMFARSPVEFFRDKIRNGALTLHDEVQMIVSNEKVPSAVRARTLELYREWLEQE